MVSFLRVQLSASIFERITELYEDPGSKESVTIHTNVEEAHLFLFVRAFFNFQTVLSLQRTLPVKRARCKGCHERVCWRY